MTLPSIPDNIYKFFLLAGIICSGYAYIEDLTNTKTYFAKVESFNSSIDSLDIELLKLDHEKDKLKRTADFLAKRYKIKNPVSDNDSVVVFMQTISGEKVEMAVSDSLSRLWNNYRENQFRIDLFNKQLKIKKGTLKDAKAEYEANQDTNFWINLNGATWLILGLIGMLWMQIIQDNLLKRQLQDKPKLYKYCQSCGKKFSSIRLVSKNADRTTNPAFCIDCFDNGIFKEPELTKAAFQKRAEIEATKRKTWLGRKMLRTRLNNLERWDTDDYF